MVSSMDARGTIDRASDTGHHQRTTAAINGFIEGHQGTIIVHRWFIDGYQVQGPVCFLRRPPFSAFFCDSSSRNELDLVLDLPIRWLNGSGSPPSNGHQWRAFHSCPSIRLLETECGMIVIRSPVSSGQQTPIYIFSNPRTSMVRHVHHPRATIHGPDYGFARAMQNIIHRSREAACEARGNQVSGRSLQY